MSNMFLLYRAELKKILGKKAVWIATILGLILILLVGLTNLSSDGMKAYVNYQEDTLSEISGQVMDEAFFENYHALIEKEIE